MVHSFLFLYPFVMSIVWMVGGCVYAWRRERHPFAESPDLPETPFVSILIPCHNEGDVLEDTIGRMLQLDYPAYEIVALNDGSTDDTRAVLERMAACDARVRVVNLPVQRGKAHALNAGLVASRGEILVTVDADAVLAKDALRFLVWHFVAPGSERVGAVTGNPRIRNRGTLLGKIQVLEYASIIGLIKRSQRVLGKIMTVSGVIAAFRKRALVDCGMWDEDMVTDDIAVSWKLERRAWDIRYEPRALCFMWAPERLRSLIRQRARWAQGGVEVLIRNASVLWTWKNRRMIPLYVEELLGIAWAYLWVVSLVWTLAFDVAHGIPWTYVAETGTWLGLTSLVQTSVALWIEQRYERDSLWRYYFYAIWYPAAYWMIGAFVVVWAVPKACWAMWAARRGRYATWKSPDRGVSA